MRPTCSTHCRRAATSCSSATRSADSPFRSSRRRARFVHSSSSARCFPFPASASSTSFGSSPRSSRRGSAHRVARDATDARTRTDREEAIAQMYGDIEPTEAARAVARLRPQARLPSVETTPLQSLADVPSVVVLARDDLAVALGGHAMLRGTASASRRSSCPGRPLPLRCRSRETSPSCYWPRSPNSTADRATSATRGTPRCPRALVRVVVRDLDELERVAVRILEVDPAPAGEHALVDDVDVAEELDALGLELGLLRLDVVDEEARRGRRRGCST